MSDSAEVAEALKANYDAQRAAMIAGDADALTELLADDFVLTHMTGYRQVKDEWVDDVRTGRMTYHSMTDVEVTFEPDDEAPTLLARTVTEATIWGSRGTWNLQLGTAFVREGTTWKAARTVASVW
jgi:hypothetical protein